MLHGLYDGLHVLDENLRGSAGRLRAGKVDQDLLLRHQRGQRVVKDRIGEGLVASAVIEDGKTRRPALRRIERVDARAQGETADQVLILVHFREMRDRPDREILVDTDGIRSVLEEIMHELIQVLHVVGFVMDQDITLVGTLVAVKIQTP